MSRKCQNCTFEWIKVNVSPIGRNNYASHRKGKLIEACKDHSKIVKLVSFEDKEIKLHKNLVKNK